MGMPAEEGVMLLGLDVMKHFGESSFSFSGRDRALVVGAGGRRWECLPGTSRAELTICAPDRDGATARVRVAVSTGYSGGILLEGPIARALGLQHFEIPGGFRIDGTEIRGERARARVRIPELDFDRVVEVQVWSDAPARAASAIALSGDPVAHLALPAPGDFVDPGTAGEDSGGPVRRRALVPGPRVPVLRRAAPGGTSSVVLAPLDGREGAPVAEVTVGALDLPGPFQPGSILTLARVWRGESAIPSREGVSRARVGPDGRASLPRVEGERGLTLGLLVERPDGKREFFEVGAEDPVERQALMILLSEAGEVRVTAGASDRAQMWDVLGEFRLAQVDPGAVAAEHQRLAGVFDAYAARPGLRDPDGTLRARLVLSAEPGARWQWIQWILQVAARPSVRIRDIALHPAWGDAFLEYRLPVDGALVPPAPSTMFRVRVLASGSGETRALRVKVGDETVEIPHGTAPEVARSGLIAALRRSPLSDLSTSVLVEAPPAGGPSLRFDDIYSVLSALDAVGSPAVLFSGAPPPR
jgi:hypothetical protein